MGTTVDNNELTDYTVTTRDAGDGTVVQRVDASLTDSVTVGGTVNISQAGSLNVTQGTSPWSISSAGSININNNPLNVNASQAGSWTTAISGTPNINIASQSLSAVTIGSGGNTLNVNVASHSDSHTFNYNIASQSLSVVTVDEGATPFNINLASQSLSSVKVDPNTGTYNVNLASQSLSAVKVTSDVNTLNVNLASQSLSAVKVSSDVNTLNINNASWGGSATTLGQKAMASSVPVTVASDQSTMNVSIAGSANIGLPPCTWTGVFTSAAGALGSFTQSAAGASLRNYLSAATWSWTTSSLANSTVIQVKDGSTVIWEEAITPQQTATTLTGSVNRIFVPPLRGTANTAMTVQFGALVAAAVEKISAAGYTGA